MTPRVFQLVPFLDSGDAIGDHARCMAQILGDRHAGFIVEQAAPEFARHARHYRQARVGPADVLVYHVAHASALGDWFARADARKVIDYHGITPASFVRGWDPGLAGALERACDELQRLALLAELALAHSEYTRRELVSRGFSRTEVLPVLIDPDRLATQPDPPLLRQLASTKAGPDLIFVSRLAPNKRIEDLIKVFAIYRRAWAPKARLFLVGRPDTGAYAAALHSFVQRLGVDGIHFAGKVPVSHLMAYYANADLFLSMSEHEGFGIPWIEAMALGVPVVSYAAAALPETIGRAGILLGEKSYDDIAAVVHQVLSDAELRQALLSAGRARAEHFHPEHAAGRLCELIDTLPVARPL